MISVFKMHSDQDFMFLLYSHNISVHYQHQMYNWFHNISPAHLVMPFFCAILKNINIVKLQIVNLIYNMQN